MDTIQEIIPFAKEMINQKPNRGMLKVYVVGSAFALMGMVLGLVQTLCLPFSSPDDAALDAELAKLVALEKREEDRRGEQERMPRVVDRINCDKPRNEERAGVSQRSSTTRLHAS